MPVSRKLKAAALAFLAAALNGLAAPDLPVIPSASFNAVTYGAVGDGRTDNTAAIQNALRAASAAQGGVVRLPAAALPYLCGPIVVESRTVLQIEAGAILQTLPYGRASNSPGTYPARGANYPDFITFNGSDVGLAGAGTIEGAGAAWWAAFAADSTIPHRPHLVQFSNCTRVLVRDVTLRNSPMFHVSFGFTSHVTIDGITISAPADSPNTDGIDPSGSHYLIQNCAISTGDDNICLKPQLTFCSDITIRNCRFGTGLGVAIGGQTNSGVDGFTVSDCTFTGTEYGLRLKADPTAGGVVQNLTYTNLTMTDVTYPIVFYSYYNLVGVPGAIAGSNRTTVAKVAAWNATAPSASYRSYGTTTLPVWRNITVSNLTATRSAGAPDGYSIIWGLPNRPVANVVLHNVTTTGYAGFAVFNAANVQLTGTTRLAGTFTSYNAQVISAPPENQVILPRGAAIFSVTAVPVFTSAGLAAPAFQWSLDGRPLSDGAAPDGSIIAGATTDRLTVLNVSGAGPGGYAVTVTTPLDSFDGGLIPAGAPAVAVTRPAGLIAGKPADVGRLINVSVRAEAGTGEANLIAGFTVGGTASAAAGLPVLVRGMGPSLSPFGVSGYLADPALTLYTGNQVIATNDDWSGAASIRTASTQAGAFPFASEASKDAALVQVFGLGGHTLQIGAPESQTGIVVAEVYDLTPADAYNPAGSARIINLSARGRIEPGVILFAGFRIGGVTARTVLIRAIGPTLRAFGVPEPLDDPKLDLFSEGGTLLLANDNWGGGNLIATAAAAVGAFPLAANTRDAVILTTLGPGSYTAQVTGVGVSRGVGLIEIYELP